MVIFFVRQLNQAEHHQVLILSKFRQIFSKTVIELLLEKIHDQSHYICIILYFLLQVKRERLRDFNLEN